MSLLIRDCLMRLGNALAWKVQKVIKETFHMHQSHKTDTVWEDVASVDMICFVDDHPDIISWFGAAHDEQTDKWTPTGIVHKIAAVDRAVRGSLQTSAHPPRP